MGRFVLAALLCSIAGYVHAPAAEACGGFFCGRQPVDQTAERIVFRVGDDSTTMVVQITYAGEAADFAWVLPLGTLPDVESLAVFPQRALTALDTNTGPVFQDGSGCGPQFSPTASAGGDSSGGPKVNVHFRAEVGPYDVAGISSEDPMALYDWLRDNAFNVNEPMLPYIEAYTAEGMKFLALKLKQDSETSDIQPFKFEFPGTAPTIPLRMTAIAAEPEMGLLVIVLGDQRYSGANWPAVEIEDEDIEWTYPLFVSPQQPQPTISWQVQTNWLALVARGVDAAGGQGWVTEYAGTTKPLLDLLDNSFFATPEDEKAGQELRALIGDAPYMTRLYSRLSAEEMISDPVFRKDAGGDVSRTHVLKRKEGQEMCPSFQPSTAPMSADPCLFTSCGAGGICRPVMLEDAVVPVAGCGCIDGATARTTVDASPILTNLDTMGQRLPSAGVVCQDARLSFVNPGDEAASGGTMDDPCAQFDCGANGECLAVNMTPTCVCDRGFVAVGSFGTTGSRATRCEQPVMPVPVEFYGQRLPPLPAELPGGRVMEVDEDLPVIDPRMEDLGSDGMPVPRDPPPAGMAGSGAPPQAGSSGIPSGDDPEPGPVTAAKDDCAVSAPGAAAQGGSLAALALVGLALLVRRRHTR